MRRTLYLSISLILASALLAACPQPTPGPATPPGPPAAPPTGKGAPPPAPPTGKGAGPATPGTPAAPAVITVFAIGVPECDVLLKMWACAVAAMPATSRAAAVQAYNSTVVAWQQVLANPASRGALTAACQNAGANMRTAWAGNPMTAKCVP